MTNALSQRRRWFHWLGMIGAVVIATAPFLVLTQHPLYGGHRLYSFSIPAAVGFAGAGITLSMAWYFPRYPRLRVVGLLLVYSCLLLTVYEFRLGLKRIEQFARDNDPLVSSFAEIVLEHQALGPGWRTLAIAIAILSLSTLVDLAGRRLRARTKGLRVGSDA